MENLNVVNWNGEKVSEVSLDKGLFFESVNKSLLHEVVKWQLARKRRGTHKAKTRSEVSGGGIKPFRQKGTGNARQGSIRSPLNEAGGVIHGPKPRCYDWTLPKKLRQKALRQALSHLLSEKNIIFVENMNSTDGKTKDLSHRLVKMKLKKALLVDKVREEKFTLACRNLKNFKFVSVDGLNVYDLLKFNKVLFTPSTIDSLYDKCGKKSNSYKNEVKTSGSKQVKKQLKVSKKESKKTKVSNKVSEKESKKAKAPNKLAGKLN